MPNPLITAKLCPIGSAAPDIFGFTAEVYSPMLVALGAVEGWARTQVLGVNPDVDIATIPEDIWYGGGAYPWKPSAGSWEVTHTDALDTGAVVTLTLLNASWYARDVTVLLGAGPTVIPGGSYLRLNSAHMLTPAAGQVTNVGDIQLRDAGGGTVRGIIPAGTGRLSSTAYSVPAHRTLAIWAGVGGFAGAENGNRAADVALWMRPSGGASYLGHIWGIAQANSPTQVSLVIPTTVPEKTDTCLRCLAISANNLQISGMLYGVEVHNSALSELVPYPGQLDSD